MPERDLRGVLEEHLEEVRQLHPIRLRVERVGRWVLHERVCSEDEVRREHRANRGQPDRRQVQLLWQAIPSKDPKSQEHRLQEEGQEPLNRERCAKDVTNETTEVRPVHPELELLHDAGDHTHCEVDQEDLAEELCSPKPLLVVGAHPRRLHTCDEEAQTDGDRHEQEMVNGGDTELKPRQIKHVHVRNRSTKSSIG